MCAEALSGSLRQAGASSSAIELTTKQITVKYDPDKVTVHQLAQAVAGTQPLHNEPYQAGLLMTVEEHQVSGALGSAVCEVVGSEHPVPVYRHGIHDRFCESGEPYELLKKYELDSVGITKHALQAMKMKK